VKTTVAIIGGGPAGSACAIHLAKLGIQSTLIESESFPRFHIGESLTEQSGSWMREMGFDEKQLCDLFPTKYGVQIYGPSGRNPFWVPVMKRDADGVLKDTFTWQVRRSKFDQMLLERAVESGATLINGRARNVVSLPDNTISGLTVTAPQGDLDLTCDVLIDASGQSTFLARKKLTGQKLDGRYSQQVAIYSHFKGVERDPGLEAGNTLVYFQKKYYWAWFIPIDAEITSIGFVLPIEYFRGRQESAREFLMRELKEFNRDLSSRVSRGSITDEVRTTSNYSYEVEQFTGKNWLCIGDAHQFIDPLFSMGVGIGLSEGRNAAHAVHAYLSGECADRERPFEDFERRSKKAIAACQTILDGFWEHTLSFGLLLSRYREDIIDMLAGHVWDDREYAALGLMEQTLRQQSKA
jgi:flavin-dependent dehydrogenase